MKRDTVLITGSSRGIGSAIAKTLAKENYNIVINYKEHEIEAKKVFDIPYKIFDIANNKILDNIYFLMFEKVEDALENEKINLSKELEEYAIFDTKSKDKNTKQLVKNKIVYKLKNSIKYRFDKDIEIEF